MKESEVKRTGHIPSGTDVHFKHLKNPSIAYLYRVIGQTEVIISSGDCHVHWVVNAFKHWRKCSTQKKNG
ncbi:MAG: hypothetical protein HKN40_07795 [Winogradskyella sp.]|uniref:hypothetical protein n=1 Tax=Winogradskyella sp. TaxID=1883156 RepID=UPI0017BDEA06|nr:hypothetical protein [Winogradskyella sp.]